MIDLLNGWRGVVALALIFSIVPVIAAFILVYPAWVILGGFLALAMGAL